MTFFEQVHFFIPGCEQELHDRRMMTGYMNHFPDILSRSNEIAHFTASSWIVNQDRTKILMIYHNIYRSWSWTGGHADGEDDPLGIAIREAEEETGIVGLRPLSNDAFSLEILTVNAHFRRGKYVVPHLHLNLTYLLEADDTLPLRSKPDENSNVAWFSLGDAVAASCEPNMREVYEKLNNRLLSKF